MSVPDTAFTWSKTSAPAKGLQATATHAAFASGQLRHKVTSFTVVLGASGTPSATALRVRLIDGASGGTAYLYEAWICIPATDGACSGVKEFDAEGWIGSPGSAVTLEFESAGGGNVVQSVSMKGTAIL